MSFLLLQGIAQSSLFIQLSLKPNGFSADLIVSSSSIGNEHSQFLGLIGQVLGQSSDLSRAVDDFGNIVIFDALV